MKKNLSKKCVQRVGRCSTLSKQSNHPNHHLGAVVVKGGRILASGYNRVQQHNKLCYRKFNSSVHAEQDAIRKLLGNPDLLYGSSLYVSRIGRSGSLLLAKPCAFCMDLIRSVGIKKIFYTDSDGSITMEKVS